MAEQEYLSLAELDLLEQQELDGFRPEADANASAPPIPAGNYLARVTYANASEPDKIWQKKQQSAEKGGKTFYMAELLVETQGNGEEFDGKRMRFYASTLVMKGSGTTSVQQVLQPMGFGDQLMQRTRTVKTQIDLMNEALEGEQGMIGVKVDWEAQVYDKEKDETVFGPVRGMKRFPKDANDNYIPEIFKDLKGNESPDGAAVNARNFIRGFCSVESLGEAMAVEGETAPAVEAEPVKTAPAPAKAAVAAPSATKTAPVAAARAVPSPRPVAAGATPAARPAPTRR